MSTAVARTNKVNTNAVDASGIFRDVYINILCKLCRLRDCGTAVAGFDEIFQWLGILKFSPYIFQHSKVGQNSDRAPLNSSMKDELGSWCLKVDGVGSYQ